MRSTQTLRNIYLFVALFFATIAFTHCKSSNTSNNKDSVAKSNKVNPVIKKIISDNGTDSIELTALIRKLYKWHETDTMRYDGFKPLKSNPSDTLYTSIDLDENKKAVEELKETGIFADSFLNDYRRIAERMDKELRNGSSLWPEGELSTFGDDSDAWCNCQDFPVDKYWNIVKLVDIKIDNGEANFKWTWGGGFYYKSKAVKKDGKWQVSYLQGFDMNAYSWEWWKKNKKTNM